MKKEKLTFHNSIADLAKSWGINYEVLQIKVELADSLKKYCKRYKISQRALAKMVPGLTQDRVSKVFSGMVGHMTIDKLVEIHSALGLSVTVKTKAA